MDERQRFVAYLLVSRLDGFGSVFSPVLECGCLKAGFSSRSHKLAMDSAIIIVSGLPRSGTSLMMQMLDKGGVEVVTDHVRTPDIDNPRGYYEFEKAKKIKEDASWLPEMRGKAFKMVSQLLYALPPTEQYRIIFMERNLDEILLSQEKMLKRLGRNSA